MITAILIICILILLGILAVIDNQKNIAMNQDRIANNQQVIHDELKKLNK
tara:strand:- start:478 stop:627 length:150 start_codon:yes stop_codon:yes gene_type:complete